MDSVQKKDSCCFSHDKLVQRDLYGSQRRKGRSSSPAPNSKVSFSSSYVDFLTTWFVASTKFLVGDDVVVVAEDDPAVSLITDAIMVQQLEIRFDLTDNNSLFVDFDGRFPEKRHLISLTTC